MNEIVYIYIYSFVCLKYCLFYGLYIHALTCCWVFLLRELFVIVDDWFVTPVAFRNGNALVMVVVVVVEVDVLPFVTVDFIGFEFVDEIEVDGGFNLLKFVFTFVGCFIRQLFVVVTGDVIVGLGNCEWILLLLLLLLIFVEFPLVLVRSDEFGRVWFVWLLRRTVAADDDVVLDDDELLIKRCDGGECVYGLAVTISLIVSSSFSWLIAEIKFVVVRSSECFEL